MSNTSLTSPSDRNPTSKPDLKPTEPTLNDQELNEAFAEQLNTDYVTKFRQVERAFCDPEIVGQKYHLFSFIPSKGATPDKDGIYGMAKCRGAYATLEESDKRAEFLIKNVDSYHKIYHCFIGKPFPITSSSDFSADTTEIDMKKKTTEIVSEDVKTRREKEQQEVKEIKERQENLMKEVEKENEPEERYTVLRVKKAQLVWTYLKTQKKMEEMKNILKKTDVEIKEMDEKDPKYREMYYQKYMDARKKSGIKSDEDSFVKYMGDDVDLDFLE